MPRLLLLCLALLGATPAARAQGTGAAVPLLPSVLEFPAPDVARLRAEDDARAHRPLRYGEVLAADVSTSNAGRWRETWTGEVWTLEVHAAGARSLGLQFSEAVLPPGAELRLLGGAGAEGLGPFAASDVHPLGGLALPPLAGDRALLELRVPFDARAHATLRLSGLVYDYRDVFALERGLTALSGGPGQPGCAVDASCPAGVPYADLRRAAVRTLDGGVLCSGALIRPTVDGGPALVLTAAHCGSGPNTIFRFAYERPACGAAQAPTDRNLAGALVLAEDAASDGALLQLVQPIPESWTPHFAGWSRSAEPPANAVCLHHPAGAPRSLALAPGVAAPVVAPFIGIGAVAAWRVEFALGGTEPGSSGGPLFDAHGHLRGALTGGPIGDCSERYFGRLDRFLSASSAARQALDPTDSGAPFVDGTDPFGPPGSQPPKIDWIAPAQLAVLSPAGAQTVVVRGSGFTGLDSVALAGRSLGAGAPGVLVLSDTELHLAVPAQPELGPLELLVTNAVGSTTATLEILPAETPVLALHVQGAGFVTSLTGLVADLATPVGAPSALLGSLDPSPTHVPGLVELDLGAGGAALILLGQATTGPSGWTRFTIPLEGTGLWPGTALHLQGVAPAPLGAANPLAATEPQAATLLF